MARKQGVAAAEAYREEARRADMAAVDAAPAAPGL
jgi:hypothetical protein